MNLIRIRGYAVVKLAEGGTALRVQARVRLPVGEWDFFII